ncbi:STAS domain-containing protein [Nonomuraea sp. NPDC048826]|uniref:STAS domain-containing protein n=1 Tax=Nonomuraea sp. NPDC048826 TaxID=3364347 RepID=UPI00371E2844
MAESLRIETIPYRGCTVLRARGVLDHAGRARFSAHVEAVWDWSPGPVLVFDLSRLRFYDASAIGVLAMALQRMRAAGSGRVILVRPTDHLLNVLRQTDLLAHVEIRDSVAEIVAELMPPATDFREPREPEDRFRYGRQP